MALVILPAVAFGGALWSQQNVTNTYETRVMEIDAQLELLTTQEAEILMPFRTEYQAELNGLYPALLEIREQKAELQEEKRILEVSYWLINNSFKE